MAEARSCIRRLISFWPQRFSRPRAAAWGNVDLATNQSVARPLPAALSLSFSRPPARAATRVPLARVRGWRRAGGGRELAITCRARGWLGLLSDDVFSHQIIEQLAH
jgi:hypothetical protein